MEPSHPNEFLIGYRRDMDGSRLVQPVCVPTIPSFVLSLQSKVRHIRIPGGDRFLVRVRADVCSTMVEGTIDPSGIVADVQILGRIGGDVLLRSRSLLAKYPLVEFARQILNAHPAVPPDLCYYNIVIHPSFTNDGKLRIAPPRMSIDGSKLRVVIDGVPTSDLLFQWTNERLISAMGAAILTEAATRAHLFFA